MSEQHWGLKKRLLLAALSQTFSTAANCPRMWEKNLARNPEFLDRVRFIPIIP
jgi:hypothetical protein